MREVDVRVPEAVIRLLDDDWESAYLRGGRWAVKSYSTADALLVKSFQRGDILCCRDFKSSTQESSHKLLAERVDHHRLYGQFDVQKTKVVNRESGATFHFAGLERMAAAVRSIPSLRLMWTEEAQYVTTLDSITSARTSVRHPGRQFVYTWNPINEDDPVEQLRNGRLDTDMDVFLTYEDNPFLGPEFFADYELNARVYDAAMMAHIFQGQYRPYATVSPFGVRNIEAAFASPPLAVPWGEPETVAGVDTAWTANAGSDWTAAVKLDSAGNELGSWHFKQEDLQTRAANLADWLQGVDFVCVETQNSDGYETFKLLRDHYGLPVYEQKMTTGEKARIVAYGTRRFAEHTLSLDGPDLKKELLQFTTDAKGSSGAAPGHNDDLVIALLLALECLRRWGRHGDPRSLLAAA